MTWDFELVSDLSLIIPANISKLIKINGVCSTCILSSKIDAGASYKVQSSIDSSERVQLLTSISGLVLEDIKINGIEYSEISFDLPSVFFKSPNFLLITNTSTIESIYISLRGNK